MAAGQSDYCLASLACNKRWYISANKERCNICWALFIIIPPRAHENKSMQRLISSQWGTGTAKFQVTWLLRIVQKGVSMWQCCAVDRCLMSGAYRGFSCAAMIFRYSIKACSYIFYLKWAFGSHVTWNSAVPDPNVWCCILLFLCPLDTT